MGIRMLYHRTITTPKVEISFAAIRYYPSARHCAVLSFVRATGKLGASREWRKWPREQQAHEGLARCELLRRQHESDWFAALWSQTQTNFGDTNQSESTNLVEIQAILAIVSKVSTNSSTPAVSSDVAELKDMVRALILDKKTPAPAPVKAVEQMASHFYFVPYLSILRSPSFTPSEEVIFTMEEIDEFLEHDDSIPPGVDGIYDSEGDTIYLENYEDKTALIKVLKSHKHAIAWKISDIKGIDPQFCTHKILMEENAKPVVQHQRRVNPKIHEVIKQEVIKLLDAGLIYPISDSPWVSPVHCVPKKGGITVVKNEENELIPTRLVTGWRVCIDYRKLNDATRKDHFPLPFMDQMLERLAGNEYYCFLDTTGERGGGDSPATFRSQLTHLIKRRLPSPALTGHLPIVACLLGYAMHRARSKGSNSSCSRFWDLPFEIMCDASDFAVGAVLGQRKTKHFQPIHYASKTMTEAQAHYTTTEKELLAVVYAFEKFRPYLVLSKSIVYTDHSALKYLLAKQDAKPRLLRWILLLPRKLDVVLS
ncbi:DNA-directed DNA polymerase [Tanacetum coccineum]